MNYYRQVILRTIPTYGGVWERVGWIPEKFAQVGRLLRIEDEGIWSHGWRVAEVYDTRKSEDAITDSTSNYLYFKKVLEE